MKRETRKMNNDPTEKLYDHIGRHISDATYSEFKYSLSTRVQP